MTHANEERRRVKREIEKALRRPDLAADELRALRVLAPSTTAVDDLVHAVAEAVFQFQRRGVHLDGFVLDDLEPGAVQRLFGRSSAILGVRVNAQGVA